MKTKLVFSILLGLSMAYRSTAQQCQQAPNCIQNGRLAGPTAVGDLNSSLATTVPNWFVSHGTPSYLSSAYQVIWMWSYGGGGEGVYTCYNFVAGRQYKVCLNARYAVAPNSNSLGDLRISATTGLSVNGSTLTPAPASGQMITSSNITNPSMTIYTYIFTANSNYNQLWIRPYLQSNDRRTQYAVEVDNIHVEDLSLADPVISIASSGPMTNGVPVNLTASGGPSGTTYNWQNGQTGPITTITPGCIGIGMSVNANYNWCPTPGIPICERTAAGVIDVIATQGCCGIINTNVKCVGSNAVMEFSITNTSAFVYNAYRLRLAGTTVDLNNSISVAPGATGGTYSVNLTALGLTANSLACFTMKLLHYGLNSECPEESCETAQFCVTVPTCVQINRCCNGWRSISYDYGNFQLMPQPSTTTNCGSRIGFPVGTANGFYFDYNCGGQCAASISWDLVGPAGTVITSGSNIGTSIYISSLPLNNIGLYTLRVTPTCGLQSCVTCELYLEVSRFDYKPIGSPKPHSLVPNPASEQTTIVSTDEPIDSFVLQTETGAILVSKKGIHKKEVTVDLHAIPKGLYTLIVNDTFMYKLVKE